MPSRTVDAVRKEFEPFARTRLDALQGHIALSLYWYSHGWERNDLVDRFASFWWTALSLVEAAARPGRNQKERISDYATGLVTRFAVAPTRADSVKTTVSDAYDARNKLFHESQPNAVTEEIVEGLERAIRDVLTWEVLGV